MKQRAVRTVEDTRVDPHRTSPSPDSSVTSKADGLVESVLGAPARTDEINELTKLLPASSSSHGLNSFISSVGESSVADQYSVGRPSFEESVSFRAMW